MLENYLEAKKALQILEKIQEAKKNNKEVTTELTISENVLISIKSVIDKIESMDENAIVKEYPLIVHYQQFIDKAKKETNIFKEKTNDQRISASIESDNPVTAKDIRTFFNKTNSNKSLKEKSNILMDVLKKHFVLHSFENVDDNEIMPEDVTETYYLVSQENF